LLLRVRGLSIRLVAGEKSWQRISVADRRLSPRHERATNRAGDRSPGVVSSTVKVRIDREGVNAFGRHNWSHQPQAEKAAIANHERARHRLVEAYLNVPQALLGESCSCGERFCPFSLRVERLSLDPNSFHTHSHSGVAQGVAHRCNGPSLLLHPLRSCFRFVPLASRIDPPAFRTFRKRCWRHGTPKARRSLIV
jgi:hypothetical protein